MPELLLELFSEEIPARMQARASADLERLVNERLIGVGFLPEGVKAFATPRRLALVATGLPGRQPDRREEKKGPRVGAPQPAIAGFLKSAGLSSLDSCEIREDKKGRFYVAFVDDIGRDTRDVIAGFLPEIIRSFPWPKSMRWSDGDLRWVRPLKRILCCFDGEVVPVSLDGIAAGDETEGHRIMAKSQIRARNFDVYAAGLKRAHVVLSSAERAAIIEGEAKTLCEARGLALIEDKGLLAEVSGLCEWPAPMMGSFDEKFLALPDEVLTASMRAHQKYFSVKDPKSGRLANKFIFVANIEAPANAPQDWGAAMRSGYERVLTARLSDAWYLYQKDLKVPLAERVKELDRVVFFEGLGSVGDKARRVAALAKEIAPLVGADPKLAEEAALLAKADLVTGMVYEFPELQGVMGRYYGQVQGARAEIADAIRDHYKPQGADDDVPAAPVSVAVALADRLVTLFAFWRIDERPSGSNDPFALRRSALGVIRIFLTNKLRVRLRGTVCFEAFAKGLGAFSYDPNLTSAQEEERRILGSLLSFFHDRFKVYLREKGHRHDHIDAVLLKADGTPEDDLVLIVNKLKSLEAFLKTDDGANLAAAYKRAANILKAEEKKDGAPANAASVVESSLQQAEEKSLHAALVAAEERADAAVKAERFEDAMSALASLRKPLDAFFEKVTVNAGDPGLRKNRLAVLARLRAATAQVADLSKLEG